MNPCLRNIIEELKRARLTLIIAREKISNGKLRWFFILINSTKNMIVLFWHAKCLGLAHNKSESSTMSI